MAFQKQMFTSKSQDWTTPLFVLEHVRRLGPIGLDPCDNNQSIVDPRISWKPPIDGLVHPWFSRLKGREVAFVNWPYGRKTNRLWAAKVAREAKAGAEIICLVAVRTSEQWFQDIILPANPAAIGFLCRRLKFSNAKHVATFSSMVIYFGKRPKAFQRAFEGVCSIWVNPRRGRY